MSDAASGKLEERLYGLMAHAEEQQQVVAAATVRLQAQEQALQAERARLAETTAALEATLARVGQVVRTVGPELGQNVRQVVQRAVAESVAGVGRDAGAGIREAVQPTLDRLAGVTASAEAADAALRRVVGWASWRLLGRGAAVVAGLALLLWLADLSVWWWTERDLALAQAQKALLLSDIAGLQGRRDELTRTMSRATLTRCGPGGRLCVRVDEGAGAFRVGVDSDYRVIQGY